MQSYSKQQAPSSPPSSTPPQQSKQPTVSIQPVPLAHNGQTSHNQRRSSKVPVRELPAAMPEYQHPTYPQLYCVQQPSHIDYKWDCIILDLDRTIIHGKRLSVKRWRKYVENGTIPSLAENQCSKWHRHIHRKGHQMHPFIRGRTMIYYRPFAWHLLAVLDYLKSHFGTKVIICTKAGEHYAASVLAALISNFTSANPDLIDDVYNFHDLHDDPEEEGKPKKPFRLICNRHDLDPKKTLIVDDNATSWFGADRVMTNFWMPPCYGYQIHDIDNELQLLCKYLWDPIQKHHLQKKAMAQPIAIKKEKEQALPAQTTHIQQTSSGSNSNLCLSPNASSLCSPKRELISRHSPKSVSSVTPSSKGFSPKTNHHLASPNGASTSLASYPSNTSLEYQQSLSSNYSEPGSVSAVSQQSLTHSHSVSVSNHNQQNALDKQQFSKLLKANSQEFHDDDEKEMSQTQTASMPHISRGYAMRKYNDAAYQGNNMVIMNMSDMSVSAVSSVSKRGSNKSPVTKTKKKPVDNKSRRSKKWLIGK